MDIFKIDLEQAQISKSLVEHSNNCTANAGHTKAGHINKDENNEDEDDEDEEQIVLPAVSFDATTDFNLHFFDTPEDSSTQGGCSEPASVESETIYYDDEQVPEAITTCNNYNATDNNQFDFIVDLGTVIEEEPECQKQIKQETNKFYVNNDDTNFDNIDIEINITAITTTTTTTITTSTSTISFVNNNTTTTSATHIGELTTVQAIVDDITAYEQHNHQKQKQQQQHTELQQNHNNNLASSSPSSSSSSSSTSSCSSNCSSLSPISVSKTLSNRKDSVNFLPNTSGNNNTLNFVSASYVDNQFNHHTFAAATHSNAANTACRVRTNGESHISGIYSSVQPANRNFDNFISNGHNTNAIAASSTTNVTAIKIEHHQQQQQQGM